MSPRISIRLLAGQSDERLLALVRDGHERAFEALVHRYRNAPLRYLRRAVGLLDPRAEDVLEQAVLQAWPALARGAEVRDRRPWLYRIAHNTALNAIRGPGERQLELVDGVLSGYPADGSPLERWIDAREALSGVAALPGMQREAILLTAIDGQSHEQAARALGISNAAVRGLVYRARTAMRTAAAAITPPPLLAWALGASSSAGPTVERVAEIASGGGVFGAGSVLLKGAAVAVTAGALATGAAVVPEAGHVARKAQAEGASAPAGAPSVRNSTSGAAGSASQVLLARVDVEGAADRHGLGAARRGSAPSPARSRLGPIFSRARLREGPRRSGGGDHGAEAPGVSTGGEGKDPALGKVGAVGSNGPSSQAPPAGESSASGGSSADGGSSGSGSSSGDGGQGLTVGPTSGSSDDGARMSAVESTSDDLVTSGH